jgi:hypothetical protein
MSSGGVRPAVNPRAEAGVPRHHSGGEGFNRRAGGRFRRKAMMTKIQKWEPTPTQLRNEGVLRAAHTLINDRPLDTSGPIPFSRFTSGDLTIIATPRPPDSDLYWLLDVFWRGRKHASFRVYWEPPAPHAGALVSENAEIVSLHFGDWALTLIALASQKEVPTQTERLLH